MGNISQEVKQIVMEIKKELENNPKVDNLERFRASLEALKMQSQVQSETSKTNILKSLENYKDEQVKTQLLNIFNNKEMSGKEKLQQLQAIDAKVSEEYIENLNMFLNQSDEDLDVK